MVNWQAISPSSSSSSNKTKNWASSAFTNVWSLALKWKQLRGVGVRRGAADTWEIFFWSGSRCGRVQRWSFHYKHSGWRKKPSTVTFTDFTDTSFKVTKKKEEERKKETWVWEPSAKVMFTHIYTERTLLDVQAWKSFPHQIIKNKKKTSWIYLQYMKTWQLEASSGHINHSVHLL